MQKAPKLQEHYGAVYVAPKKMVDVPVFRMPETADGRPRFPSRSDGYEAAIMRGALRTVKVALD